MLWMRLNVQESQGVGRFLEGSKSIRRIKFSRQRCRSEFATKSPIFILISSIQSLSTKLFTISTNLSEIKGIRQCLYPLAEALALALCPSYFLQVCLEG